MRYLDILQRKKKLNDGSHDFFLASREIESDELNEINELCGQSTRDRLRKNEFDEKSYRPLTSRRMVQWISSGYGLCRGRVEMNTPDGWILVESNTIPTLWVWITKDRIHV